MHLISPTQDIIESISDAELLERIHRIPKWQQKLSFNENVTSPGHWDPAVQYNLFASHLPDLRGLRVLDVGANAGGLSFVLHEAGARVTSVEPYAPHREQFQLYCTYRGIEGIDLYDGELFDIHTLGEFDVIFCLGLVYHFRFPQLVLDYLASFHKGHLIVSTQIVEGDGLWMQNRRTSDASEQANEKPLTGWEPTVELFLRMLIDANLKDAVILKAGKQESGFTNGAYFYVPPDEHRSFDMESAKRRFM